MGPTMKDLGIDRLQPEQKIALALEIWDSLEDARPGGNLTEAMWREIDRRDAELDANPGIEMTWHLHDGGLGCPGFSSADSPGGGYARFDGLQLPLEFPLHRRRYLPCIVTDELGLGVQKLEDVGVELFG